MQWADIRETSVLGRRMFETNSLTYKLFRTTMLGRRSPCLHVQRTGGGGGGSVLDLLVVRTRAHE